MNRRNFLTRISGALGAAAVLPALATETEPREPEQRECGLSDSSTWNTAFAYYDPHDGTTNLLTFPLAKGTSTPTLYT